MENQTKQRPIVLTAQEVLAIRSRNKIQHRIPLSPQPHQDHSGHWTWESGYFRVGCHLGGTEIPFRGVMQRNAVGSKAAPFKVGDRVWAQEEHRPIAWSFDDGEVTIEYRDGRTEVFNHLTEEEMENNPNDDYLFEICDELSERGVPIKDGTDSFDFSNPDNSPLWRAAEAMPLFASRAVFEITNVRFARIQDINEAEALASGLAVQSCEYGSQFFLNPLSRMETNVFHRDEWRSAFSAYWDSLNGIGEFDKNPWVWVLEFKKVQE